MRRKVRFRGKSIQTGEWVYGYYAVHHIPIVDDVDHSTQGFQESPAIFNDEPGNRNGSYWANVDGESVGQFTSLYDKNRKEIYEGDIIKIESVKEKLEVRFVRGVFAFLWGGNLDDEFPTGSPTHEWAEVIGNIHDNPKLLKQKMPRTSSPY